MPRRTSREPSRLQQRQQQREPRRMRPPPRRPRLTPRPRNSTTARDNNLLTKLGASTTSISRATIERMPQADNLPLDKLILQFPGVSYDSAASNPNFHVRGEYANVQIRINGIVVPEGVSALGPFLDTNFIGNISLLTGALAGAIRAAHRRRARHHQPEFFRLPAVKSVSTAAAGRRLRRASTMAAVSAIRSTSFPRAAIGTVSGLKARRRG